VSTDAWKALSDEPGEPLPFDDTISDDEWDRWMHYPRKVQEALARGDVTEGELLARIAASADAELCPRCCERPATIESTGLCRPCHDKALAAAHREYMAEVAANQERATARQQSKRLRDELGLPPVRGYLARGIGLSTAYGVRKDGRPTVGSDPHPRHSDR
jgi:hypothetical protein